jgi:hypothetical protein
MISAEWVLVAPHLLGRPGLALQLSIVCNQRQVNQYGIKMGIIQPLEAQNHSNAWAWTYADLFLRRHVATIHLGHGRLPDKVARGNTYPQQGSAHRSL